MTSPVRPRAETLQTLDVPPREATAEAWQLFVLREGTSSTFPLPRSGTVTIGRAPEAQLVIDDGSISRFHARLTLTSGQTAIVDLGSRNGTAVNGRRLTEPRELVPGDVVQIGTVTLVLTGTSVPTTSQRVLSLDALRRRLVEELARAAHDERPTAAIALQLEDRPAEPGQTVERIRSLLRAHDLVAWADPAQLLIVLPELDGDEAQGLASRLMAAAGGPARAGVASSPTDALDTDSLLQAARAAAAGAAIGQVDGAGRLVRRLQLGRHVLLTADPTMFALEALIRRLALTDLPLLITGETGTGKELAASAVHHHSPRRDGPFVAINCAAIQDSLLESELFGHERGAFTGANLRKEGLLESARGGTVFLDEVGELSPAAQAKLLRAVETRRITRVGDVKERPIDVRIVAATHRDLQAAVQAGRFREDLYFRLGGATIALPPLRHRRGEIPVLARAFLDEVRAKNGRGPSGFSMGTLHALVAHHWPGNVRELRNVVMVLAATVEGDVVERWHLPESIASDEPDPPADAPTAALESALPNGSPPPPGAPTFRRLSEEIRELELARIRAALEATGGVQKHAARLIGVPLRTFVMKAKRYGLTRRSR